jgi:hypothetical protein
VIFTRLIAITVPGKPLPAVSPAALFFANYTGIYRLACGKADGAGVRKMSLHAPRLLIAVKNRLAGVEFSGILYCIGFTCPNGIADTPSIDEGVSYADERPVQPFRVGGRVCQGLCKVTGEYPRQCA